MQVQKQQLELDMEQQTGSKLGKEYIKAVCCHLAYMQSTSSEMLGWMKHKLELRLRAEISITNPLQCSCLENPRDSGASWAAISGVAQSRT